MSSVASEDTTTRGRPRSADRTEAILDAAVEVMRDLGWDGFTMQAVATRAGAGLATIYRRWPTKEDLVAAAMRRDIDNTYVVDAQVAPRDALEAILVQLGDKLCQDGGSVISVLAAAREHEAMRSALDDTVRTVVRETIGGLIDQLVGPGSALSATLTDAILGSLIFRSGMLEMETTGQEFADEMLALVDALSG